MAISRRDFIALAALGTLPLPRVLLRAAEKAGPPDEDGILVVLQLSGGNDGLNTVVPYESDVYRRSRPVLALGKGAVLPLAETTGMPLGLHPRMRAFLELFDEGRVAIIPGVGYPNPSRSHFRSMDIWHTAEPGREDATDGWLGRTIERRAERLGLRGLPALSIGDGELPLALEGDVPVPSLQSLDFLDFLATPRGRRMRSLLRGLHERPREGRPSLEGLRTLAGSTLAGLDKVIEIRDQRVPVDYPGSSIGRRLKLAGQLIAGGYPSRIYYLSQGGYDTHARQEDVHGQLLSELSDGLGAFFEHVGSSELGRRVTLLVFSEFGRRVAENGSLGTDHGTAAPVFIVSGRAKGGIHGSYPDLEDLEDGDLRHGIDFRRIYATLLEDVLGVESAPVLGGRFEKLAVL